jgi:hypothetical protein
VVKRDWTTYSNYAYHSRVNSQRDWGDLCDHLMSTRFFTVIMKMIFMCAWINMRQMANHLALIVWFISYKKQISHCDFNVEA